MNTPDIDINGKLRSFNTWWDSFILEAIKPVAILSMGLGTVAIFNLQGLAIHPAFVTSWAIVQAMSIDGLFFATWDRLFAIQPSREKWLPILGLSVIGVALAIVAIAINAVLGFQVLWAIGNSQEAMARLGVSSELFTVIRAILAVTVFVMVSFVRIRARATTEPHAAIVAPVKRSQKRATVVEEKATVMAIAQHSVAIEDSPLVDDSPSHKDKIKAIWLRYEQEGKAINMKAIAFDAGVGYSTVKKHASAIKQELGEQ